MGPDWKIYCGADPQIDSLHCINNPSLSGLACNYQKNAVYIGPNQNNQCLIQFLQKYKAYIHHGSLCQWNPVHLIQISGLRRIRSCGISGDPGSGADNFSDIRIQLIFMSPQEHIL